MLKEQIREDIKSAMKAGDKAKLSALRMVLSEISYGETLATPVDELQCIKKYKKKIADALVLTDTPELQYELSVVSSYLPQQASQAEVEAVITELLGTGTFDKSSFGVLMKQAKEKLPNADGKQLSELLKAKLG